MVASAPSFSPNLADTTSYVLPRCQANTYGRIRVLYRFAPIESQGHAALQIAGQGRGRGLGRLVVRLRPVSSDPPVSLLRVRLDRLSVCPLKQKLKPVQSQPSHYDLFATWIESRLFSNHQTPVCYSRSTGDTLEPGSIAATMGVDSQRLGWTSSYLSQDEIESRV